MDTISGIPAHPLLVHIPVVLVPLAALIVIVIVIRPALMRSFGIVVAVLSGVGFLGALFAASTGEALEDQRREAGETIAGTLKDHVEMGDTAQWIVGVFFLLTLAWVLFAWWRRRAGDDRAAAVTRSPKQIALVLAVLAVLSGAAATYSVTVTGHSGAKSVWEKSEP